ncbi:peptidoglycan-binding domain-containing protein [Flavobacterium sp. ABG]|uniref:peptidoglycan-binding domain-containing protein n=1 Tax=Flavobacterium sp. ABG TaxID=1423322 RepID=UPI00064B4DC3|nr:hypothetical protein [Flavobacterium sp. ABG]KLT67932.1 hypothetical protein AB674_20085 [Flavobacterium sp. ABG]
MKVNNEDKVLIGVGLVAVSGIGYLYWRKKQRQKQEELLTEVPEPDTVVPQNDTIKIPSTGAVLDKNKLLSKGSKGVEVRELQRLLGVTIDGVFGNKTSLALQSKKGVSRISLNTFSKTKNSSKNVLNALPIIPILPKKGQKLMANQNDVSLYNAKKTASGSYFNIGTKPFIGGSFDYGEHIGVFVGAKTGGQYLINRDGVHYFVNASAIKAY